MFEKLSRLKIRFNSIQGPLSVEDLWDLPLVSKVGKASLDNVAQRVAKRLKEADDFSFVENSTAKTTHDELRLNTLKHIINVRKLENESKLDASKKAERKNALLEALAAREVDAVQQMTAEQLQAELDMM